jgi:hypothetical protein
MKFRAVVVLLALMAPAIAIIFSGCASLPPQSRPTTVEPFLGTWTGSWRSNVNSSDSGSVQVEIVADTKRNPNGVIYNATSPQFKQQGIKGELRNGELLFTTSWRAQLTFALYGTDRMEVNYFNPGNQDSGTWSLSRK